jgi:hypothetical protein
MSCTLGAITLHEQTLWLNEYDYSAISHNQQFTLSGRQVIQSFKRQTGQEIVLDCRWLTKAVLDDLLAIDNDNIMLLTLPDTRQFNVIFDRRKQPIESEPILRKSDPADTDVFQVKLNLITV